VIAGGSGGSSSRAGTAAGGSGGPSPRASKAPARKPLVAGNWKMNKNHFEALALTQKLAFALKDKDFAACDIAILPPFTALRSVQTLIEGDKLRLLHGAQDLSPHQDGAYTGDISGRMLAKLGCQFVLAGHSERRQYHHEDNELVNAKVKAAIGSGITPILCVGEPLEVRQAGDHLEYTLSQLDGGLAALAAEQLSGLVVAYEPVWAIGTGEVATPADAQEVCGAIRGRISATHGADVGNEARILYGGSVKPDNMPAIMAGPDIDGALVGGASLDAAEFVKICRYRDEGVAA
jgi:triosephosphate isomerase (TIM)